MPIVLFTAFSCKEVEPTKEEGFSSIYLEDKSIDYKETLVGRIWITASSEWEVVCKEDWLIIDPKSGPAGSHKVTITATENKDNLHDRAADVIFSCGSDSRKMTVTQSRGPIIDPVEPIDDPVEPEPGPSSDEVYITDHFSSKMHFSTGRLRTMSAVMQSFDIDFETNTIYYSQLNNQFRAYISAGAPGSNTQPPCMTVNYFGHVSNFSLEKDNGKAYIWVDNFSSKNASGDYWGSTVVSRIPYVSGSTITSWEAPENYYFGEKNISVAVDIEGDMLTYLGISTGNCYTYRLSELRALPIEDVTLPAVTYGGEAKAPDATEVTKSHVIKARDCTKVKPIGKFIIPRGKYANGETISWQGFDIKGGLVYQMQGNGHADGTPSPGWLQIRDINGGIILPLTKIKALEDLDALKAAGITDIGYMEPEGVKVHGDYIYIGFASKNSKNERRGTIFKFTKKAIR